MNYAWAVKGQAVSNGQFSIAEIYQHPLRQSFRMLDDDGNVYFQGYWIPLSDEATGFEPLDDYGMPDSGCTSIEYEQKDGSWKRL